MAHFPTRTTTKHQLSSFKDNPTAWVELYTDLGVAEVEKMQEDEKSSNFTKGLIMLTSLITAWGFTESDGTTPAAITLDNVRLLGMDNINELLDLVNMPSTSEAVDPKASAS